MAEVDSAIAFAQHMIASLPKKDFSRPISEQEFSTRVLAEAAYRDDVKLSVEEIRELMATAGLKPRRAKFPFEARDVLLIATLRVIRDKYGFTPTVNPGSSNESGCSIIQQALERYGVYMTVGNVEKIWQKRKAYDKRMAHWLESQGFDFPIGSD